MREPRYRIKSATMLSTDFDLLAAWKAGDRRAGQELFHRHYVPIYRFFDSKIGEDTETLVGSTFLKCRANEAGDFGALRLLLLRLARANLYEFLEHRADFAPSHPPDPLSMTIEELGGMPTTVVPDAPESLHRALTRIPLESQLIMEIRLVERLTTSDLAYVLDTTTTEAEERVQKANDLLCMHLRLPPGSDVGSHFGLAPALG